MAFEKVGIHGRLTKLLVINADYAIEIIYVEGENNLLSGSLSRSVEKRAVEENEEEKNVIEEYFWKHFKE